MNQRYYILDDENRPVPADVQEWGWFFSDMKRRRVALDRVGGCDVSTVFIGLDHRFGDGPPLLFETMVFSNIDAGEWADDECHRFSSWDDALTGHQATVRRLKDAARGADVLLSEVLK